MPITATCPSCSQKLQVDDQYAGKQVRCPGQSCAVLFCIPVHTQNVPGLSSDQGATVIHFQCPTCENSLEAHPEESGNMIDCPKCGDPVRIPSLQELRQGEGRVTHSARASQLPKRGAKRKPENIPLGWTGLALVAISFLSCLSGNMNNLAIWYIGALTSTLGFIGLFMCVVAIGRASGEVGGCLGIFAFILKTALFLYLMRSCPPFC